STGAESDQQQPRGGVRSDRAGHHGRRRSNHGFVAHGLRASAGAHDPRLRLDDGGNLAACCAPFAIAHRVDLGASGLAITLTRYGAFRRAQARRALAEHTSSAVSHLDWRTTTCRSGNGPAPPRPTPPPTDRSTGRKAWRLRP